MLNATMIEKLNTQIKIEHESSNLYLQMSAWCAWKGYEGAAAFLHAHSGEERMHMMKLFTYMEECGALALIGGVEQPKAEWTSLGELFAEILKHEQFVTASINGLVATAYEQKDFSTLNFLQWYVAEQHEEEGLFSMIIDRLKLVGDDNRGLYFFDRDLRGLTAQRAAAAPAGQGA
jgi:ferritin